MRIATSAALLLSFVVVGACSAEAAPPPTAPTPTAPTPTPTTPTAPTPTAPTPTAPTPTSTSDVVPAGPRGVALQRYEAVRAALAADQGAAVSAELVALKAAVDALVAQKVDGAADLQRGVDGLVTATTTKNGAAIDLKAVRLAFGVLSRGVVAVVAADPALQQGRFLFECPMAAGYQRWVQTAPSMMNPYMGRRMLECGSPVAAWKVEG